MSRSIVELLDIRAVSPPSRASVSAIGECW